MEIRPLRKEDFAAAHAVLVAAEGGLREQHGFPWRPPPLEAFAATHGHLLATDPDRSFAAVEDEGLVGYAAAWVRGGWWFLSDLFVAPGAQAGGVGSRLLAAAWGEGPERRLTLADAIQPVSNGMYARRGLIPATPVLELGGAPRAVEADGLEPAPVSADALAALDAAAYRFDRAVDHRFWGRGAARATLWLRGSEPAAYAYVSRSGRIGPLAGADPAAAALALRAELARADCDVSLDVPGSARELVEVALAAGLAITGPPGLLLLSRGLAPPRALAISGYWLL